MEERKLESGLRDGEKQEGQCDCWSVLRCLDGFSYSAVGVWWADGSGRGAHSILSLTLENLTQRAAYHHRRSSIYSVDYRGCAPPARNVPTETRKDAKIQLFGEGWQQKLPKVTDGARRNNMRLHARTDGLAIHLSVVWPSYHTKHI